MSESMEESENEWVNLKNSGGSSMDQEEGVTGGEQDELLPSGNESANLEIAGGSSKDQEEGVTGGEQAGSSNNQEEGFGKEDMLLPLDDVVKIMKKALPGEAEISQEAKEAIQECATEFIFYITSEAARKCKNDYREETSGEDLIYSLDTFKFKEYLEPLNLYRYKYWEEKRKERWERNLKALADEFPADDDVEAESTGAAKVGETSGSKYDDFVVTFVDNDVFNPRSPSLTLKNKDVPGSGSRPSGERTSGNMYGHVEAENTAAAMGGETSGNMYGHAEAENTGAAMGGETSGNMDVENKDVYGSASDFSGGETV